MDVREEALARYQAAAAALKANLDRVMASRAEQVWCLKPSPDAMERVAREEAGRAAWLAGIRQRLQLVTIEDGMPPTPERWPAGVDPADYRDLGGVKMTFPPGAPVLVEEIPPGT